MDVEAKCPCLHHPASGYDQLARVLGTTGVTVSGFLLLVARCWRHAVYCCY